MIEECTNWDPLPREHCGCVGHGCMVVFPGPLAYIRKNEIGIDVWMCSDCLKRCIANLEGKFKNLEGK